MRDFLKSFSFVSLYVVYSTRELQLRAIIYRVILTNVTYCNTGTFSNCVVLGKILSLGQFKTVTNDTRGKYFSQLHHLRSFQSFVDVM